MTRPLARAWAQPAVLPLVLLVSWLWCAPSQAQTEEEDIPRGRIGVRAAASGNSTLGLGFVVAAVAGYHPTDDDERVSFGAEWSAGWSYYESNEASITGSLRLLSFAAGVRMRLRPSPAHRRFVVVTVGGTLVRANAPVAPDLKRSYLGPYISIGFEPKVGTISLGIDARVGPIATGPTTISIGVTATLGK